jgi:ABC-type multidrug transport system ATPase subunit
LIVFQSVGHTYRSMFRRVRAVDDFSLEIREGEVFGLAGPNGAGKSTLISLMLGFMSPSDGELRIAGLRPREYVERHGIGFVSELMNVPLRWEMRDTLVRYALLAGVGADELNARVDRAIERLGIAEHRGKRVKQLSKGNLQRLGIAQALLRDERILVLDEPTHGLDPVWSLRFRDIVSEIRSDDRVVFIASHNLDELQRLCDRVAIIDHGRLERVIDLRAPAAVAANASYRLTMAAGHELVTSVFADARELDDGVYELPSMELAVLNTGLAALIARGALVSELTPLESLLERAFRQAVAVEQRV